MKSQFPFRLLFIGLFIAALFIYGSYSDSSTWFNLRNLSEFILSFGVWGYFAFIGIIILGSFINIPVFIFVAAAILTYGQLEGTILGFAGALISAIVNFSFVRHFGGFQVGEFKSKYISNLMLKLEEQPIFSLISLRFFFWANPILNFSLGVTKMRLDHFIIGTFLGLLIPFLIFSIAIYYFKDRMLAFIGG